MINKFIDGLIPQALKNGIFRCVVAAVIANERREVLLLQRSRHDFLSGIYELPNGKVEG